MGNSILCLIFFVDIISGSSHILLAAAKITKGDRKLSEISWAQFEHVDLRVGTVLRAEDFPEAKKPAIKLWIDFGKEIGTKCSSAQITDHYQPTSLVGRQVIAVTNLTDKQIGPFISECLVTGFIQSDQSVVLAVPDMPITNGTRLA